MPNNEEPAQPAAERACVTKPLPWLRLYTEVIDDEKLLLLAFEDRWHYIALLACKGRGLLDKDEARDLMFRKVALKLGLSRSALDEMARRLAEVGLIDKDSLQPLAWDNRQFRSDSDTTAAERKRRQRERAKGGNDVSRVTGTDVTRTDTDTDADSEGEKIPPKAPKGETGDALFDEAFAAYPKRDGGNSRTDARKAWNARRKAGVPAQEMIDGVKRYAAFIRARGKEGTEYVKQAATFFGPSEHWKGDYPVARPGAPAGNARDAQGNAVSITSQQRSFRGVQYGGGRVDPELAAWADEQAGAEA